MQAPAPIFLYTDFGSADLYVGQVKAVLHAEAPGIPVVDLLNDAPNFDITASAHLLAALSQRLPSTAVTLAVVDPGVGSARASVVVEAEGRWFVGPDNGLMSVVAGRARGSRCFPLAWMPEPEFVSFHGRDLFAPAAARIARGALDWRELTPKALDIEVDAGDLAQIVYIDHYGNAMTGMRAATFGSTRTLEAAGRQIPRARVFSDAAIGELFWYANSIGLIEIAANRASAAQLLGLAISDPVIIPDR